MVCCSWVLPCPILRIWLRKRFWCLPRVLFAGLPVIREFIGDFVDWRFERIFCNSHRPYMWAAPRSWIFLPCLCRWCLFAILLALHVISGTAGELLSGFPCPRHWVWRCARVDVRAQLCSSLPAFLQTKSSCNVHRCIWSIPRRRCAYNYVE